MELYNRRLLLLNEDEPYYSDADSSSPPRLTTAPISSSLFVIPLKLSAPVPSNSDVAYLIILLLLLIAFIILFIRRFTDHSPASGRHAPPASSNYHSPSSSSCGGGLDPSTIQSLPVFRYNSEAKHQDDCVICLSELEIGEAVKIVPNCKHVFHRECIDMWLSSHVTCPICRGSNFFAVERQAESDKVEPTSDRSLSHQPVPSTVENGDTWREGRTMGTLCSQRRSRSCSSFRDTVILRRTLSY